MMPMGRYTHGLFDPLVVFIGNLLAVVAILLITTCTVAYAHDEAIIRCDRNLKVDHVTKLGEETLVNGLLSERYDRNDDGVTDITALSSITGTTTEESLIPHRPNPVFWQVDLDFDGLVDIVYVDVHGEGKCEDIGTYINLHDPLPDDMFHGYDPTNPEDVDLDHVDTQKGDI